jgi:hypothetical protein
VARFPSGTVTFLFTDIEGSTALLQELGDAYGSVVSDHRRILRQARLSGAMSRAASRFAISGISA